MDKKQDDNNASVMIRCVQSRDFSGLQKLLVGGADINLKDSDGKTALAHAVSYSFKGIDMNLVKLLCEHGADVNAQDNNGSTPLMISVLGKNADLTKYLISQGADIQRRNSAGFSAVMSACRFSDPATIALLLEQGAPLHELHAQYGSLLHFAVESNNIDTLKFLLERFDDPDMKIVGSIRATPLLLAVEKNFTDAAMLLINRGAEVNFRIPGGFSPLMTAVSKRNRVLAEALMAAGADVNARFEMDSFYDGATVLMCALGRFDSYAYERVKPPEPDRQILEQLLERGADVYVTDKYGKSSLDMAKSMKNQKFYRLLKKR